MRFPKSLAVAIIALTTSSFAAAQSPLAAYAGTYAEHIGPRTFRVLRLVLENGRLAGSLEQPRGFDGGISVFITDPRVESWPIVKTQIHGGALYFTVQSPRNKTNTDDYILRLSGSRAELLDDEPDAALDPHLLDRVASAQVFTGWQQGRMYNPDDSDTDNVEIKMLYDADQKVREAGMPTTETDIRNMYNNDAARRARVHEMLTSGLIHTGHDFERAAFIFQHGDTPDDFLLAHTLAMISVARGDSNSIWIAAATLDRYLAKTGKPQIYGTQYSVNSVGQWTQEPYDRTLISDAIRAGLNVPSQPAQARQLDMFQKQITKP
jgi:hypothetical protein